MGFENTTCTCACAMAYPNCSIPIVLEYRVPVRTRIDRRYCNTRVLHSCCDCTGTEYAIAAIIKEVPVAATYQSRYQCIMPYSSIAIPVLNSTCTTGIAIHMHTCSTRVVPVVHVYPGIAISILNSSYGSDTRVRTGTRVLLLQYTCPRVVPVWPYSYRYGIFNFYLHRVGYSTMMVRLKLWSSWSLSWSLLSR